MQYKKFYLREMRDRDDQRDITMALTLSRFQKLFMMISTFHDGQLRFSNVYRLTLMIFRP